ncbi:unnamed protein product [Rangifer tarandus platyrhynchus]|uniref:Uncharacterized protein n=2 Tax=Rangifer tarandus platyrhynchus TaxID=3082113 RepID=A0AC59YZ80_RANTA|nr:unnamed protein product [Rangifer tarandus platyrhynchus]
MPSYLIDLHRGDDCGSVDRTRQALSGSASPAEGSGSGQTVWVDRVLTPSPFLQGKGGAGIAGSGQMGRKGLVSGGGGSRKSVSFPGGEGRKGKKNQSGKKIKGQVKLTLARIPGIRF